jgi:plasmid maintenance system antidote protein VapI
MANLRNLTPFMIFGSGDHIKELLEVYNWTAEDLELISGISSNRLKDIITHKEPISLEIAQGLSKPFGMSIEFWLNHDKNYRLKIAQVEDEVLVS